MNFTRFPRRMYLQGETPIQAMPRLSKVLGNEVNLFIKRDDLLPGCAGGNKTRKLEFCIADALEKGADSLITCGAIQSNHCRLTLAWSKIEQLDCHLILEERIEGSYDEDASGNNFLFKLLGAASSQVVKGGTDMAAVMESKAEDLRSQGKKPYIIPGGASNAIGALGYAACAAEIMNQINTMQLPIDHIVLPSGSAGTHAGMVSGMTGLNVDIPISGINVSRDRETQEALVYKLAQETVKKLNIKPELKQKAILCFDEYVGAGYSIPTNGMIEAVQLFARNEAILLDPVYSGKAASGLIDLVQKNYFTKGSNILFLHTGGSPALYAYQDFFREEM
ncbi:MAG: D-cysteine desulfhydrase [Gammaproteobacteria bacterium]|jgi:D-cysteine desulfhydrase|nr:D-cysteine desulfhydrase [Gammaproteobacteria bacterium]MBT3723408.1 D-cysteine desulfhydrase [Gammaproteobacteria bacterium]MBT4077649.1 D-cysteine desulfhydrase [Gammaproteobacteria bacterium]MBT4196346.1 D-cysteine desulfhydrase [Gammaproteobacteria bacterium]MBT4452392.1 D-cysteine desulfhydrase [Gammaproteobacteria bacterium]